VAKHPARLTGSIDPVQVYSLVGGVLSAGLFVTTLCFMATSQGVIVLELGFPAISVTPGS
jgi:uncharacterized membrane protein YkgB